MSVVAVLMDNVNKFLENSRQSSLW